MSRGEQSPAGVKEIKVDYILAMQVYFRSTCHSGELTDAPIPSTAFTKDDIISTWYDAKLMQWLFSRPSGVKYPMIRRVIKNDKSRTFRWGDGSKV